MSIDDSLRRAASARRLRLKRAPKIVALLDRAASDEVVIDVFQTLDEPSCLVVTSRGVHVVTPKMMSEGTIRSAQFTDITDVERINGVFSGAIYRDVRVTTASGELDYRFLFLVPSGTQAADEATLEIGESTRSQAIDLIVSRVQGNRDPELEQVNRAIQLAHEGPPVGSGDAGLSSDDIVALASKWDGLFAQGEYQAIWEQRLTYGYGVGFDSAPRTASFWFNAFPAAAAVRLGVHEHPAAAMCGGYANTFVDRSDPQQSAAMSEIERAFA